MMTHLNNKIHIIADTGLRLIKHGFEWEAGTWLYDLFVTFLFYEVDENERQEL